MAKNDRWTLLRDMRPDGHAYFKDDDHEDGRIAIADCSGYYPQQTDDGVLYIDAGIGIEMSGGRFSLGLSGGQSTPISQQEMEWLAESLPYLPVRIGRIRVVLGSQQ